MKRKTNNNPNKVNQYTEPDPRQIEFLKLYIDPKSKTFGDAYNSAKKVGYSEEYSKVVVSQMPKWLSRKLKINKRLAKAEENLEEVQNLDIIQKKIIKTDDKIEVIRVLDPNILKTRTDVDKFIAKTHDKETYSERIDHTTKGEPIKGINYIVPTNGDNSATNTKTTPSLPSVTE